MKNILVKVAPKAIAGLEDFKAGDLYGLAWQVDSPLHPTARRIESMLPDEKEALLTAVRIRQEASTSAGINTIPGGLYYLVSSYGVPIAWLTCDGTVHRTRLRHSDATARHLELAVKGLQELSNRMSLETS